MSNNSKDVVLLSSKFTSPMVHMSADSFLKSLISMFLTPLYAQEFNMYYVLCSVMHVVKACLYY